MNFIQVAIFILFTLVVLGGSHLFLYFSIVKFFHITSLFQKNVLLILSILLASSFIIASILAHWYEGIFTRTFYFISGFWLGLLTNLILASVIVWLIGRNKTMAIIFFTIALIYSLYGTWNALNPRIKNISVRIPDLPEQWQGKKIVQLSDVHLGLVYRDNFLRKIVKEVNSVNPEMVVITGDLFDGMDGDLNYLIDPLNSLRAENGIFFITGNHEIYLGIERALSALSQTKIKILKDEVVDVNGLKIIGISYPASGGIKGDEGDTLKVVESLKKDFSGKPNILLHHPPVYIDEFKNSGVNLQLSGHTHKGQIFPFGFISKAIYKGYDYGLHQVDNYTLYTTTGVGTWGPTMRTGNHPEIVVITLQP